MELLPDDLRRIVFAFSAPTVGARQLAARARTLDEFVEHRRLEDEPGSSMEWKLVEQGVAHTRTQLDLLGALRTVSKDWRNLISYGSTRQLTSVLRPLSLAVPELRVLMHSDDEGRTPKGASMRCWHARCGHDWTDPVFY